MTRKTLQPVFVYCGTIAALGAALFALLVVNDGDAGTAFARPEVWALSLSVLVAELLPLKVPRRSGDGEVTLSTTFSFALLLTAGVVPALAAQATASAVQDVWARKPLWRILFNIGQYSFGLAVAAGVMHLIRGFGPPLGTRFGAIDVLAIAVAAGAHFCVNTGLVAPAIALHYRVPLLSYLRSDLVFNLSVNAVLLGLSPIVVTTLDFSPILFPLFIVPIAAIWQGGRQAAHAAYVEHQALHDALTGLPNRRYFREQVSSELEASDGSTAAMLLIDLNRFKEINDTLGHHHGDLVLSQVGPRLHEAFREQDLVARLGGDEFAVFIGADGALDAHAAAERFAAALQRPFEADGLELELDASVGIALYPDHGTEVDTLLQRADIAMYRAKESHRLCVQYDPHTDFHSHARLALVSDLRRALAERRLLLHYQPQVDLRTGATVAVEGLVRWDDPDVGLRYPGEFLDVAEDTGLIRDMTYDLIDCGLSDLRRWRQTGVEVALSLNLSARCLVDRELTGQIEMALRRHGIPGEMLTLELTESSLMAEPTLAKETMEALSTLGISLAIDDFGTGYSSLAYLTELPVSELKIDKSFVLEMQTDARKYTIVRSTVELGRNLRLRTVAEGIEDESTLRRIMELGCDRAQGYYVSRPVPPDQVLEWLKERRPEAPPMVFDVSRFGATA